MAKKVIFRADGGSSTGLGHLYRLFSLVEIVKNSLDFIFITHASTTYDVIPSSYKKKIIPEIIQIQEEPQWLADTFSPDQYIIIADGYHFNSKYQKKIKEEGYKLLYIDDLAEEHMYADVVINHSPYIKKEHYSKETYTKLALGTQYALLRPLFLKEAKQNRSIQNIASVFICFGGADPLNLTLIAVKAFLRISCIKKINVVIGGANKYQDIYDLEQQYQNKVKVFKNLSEKKLIEIMRNSDFAIAPASTILFELCCVKMPILSGFYVDNQESIYNGFLNKNAIYGGGNMTNYEIPDFEQKIHNILDQEEFNLQIKAQKSLFDNKIESRHFNLIKELC